MFKILFYHDIKNISYINIKNLLECSIKIILGYKKMAILELKNIVKKFNDTLVVDNVSMSIEQGEFFTLLGPSGCGKTTILRMIAGFDSPDSGQIFLDGHDIKNLAPEKRPLHTVFQSYALFPHMSVRKNIEFPLKMAKWDKSKIDNQVDELMEDVKLSQFANRYPHELSGGQRQRVAIARALVDRPKLLLLDEPLSALDASLREHMHVELVKLQEETGVTFIYVTHDQREALALSSRIAVINNGQIEQLDTPTNIYAHPKTFFVSDFIGKCNLLKAKIINKTPDEIKLKVENSFEVSLPNTELISGNEGWFAIRPEHIRAHRTDHEDEVGVKFLAKVKNYYYYGDGTLYEFILENGTIIQSMLPNTKAKKGDFFAVNEKVHLLLDPHAGNFLVN